MQEQPQQTTYSTQPKKGVGLAVSSLVLGIIATIFSFIPIIGIIAFFLAIPALLLGIIALVSKTTSKGLAVAGTVLSIVAIGIAGIFTALTAAFVKNVDESMNKTSTVKYVLTSNAPAKATYWKGDGTSNENFTGTLEREIEVKGPVAANVTVTPEKITQDTAQMTCEIFVNGKSVSQNSGTSLISCSDNGRSE